MSQWPTKLIGELVAERTERLGQASATIFSVTNENGFVRSLDLFDKQVFSADTGNYKRVAFHDLAYNPSRINVGSVAMCEDKDGGAVSPMYVIVRCKPGLLPRYLLHFLKSESGLHLIRRRCEGTVRFQLKFRDLCSISIPAPPLSEQQRIVRLLDAAEELRRLREQADRRTAAIVPALFHEMFGDPVSNPKGWDLTPVRNVAKVQSGLTLGQHRGSFRLRKRYLRVANVQRGFLELDEVKEIGLTDDEYEKVKLTTGDLLLVEGNGNPQEIGRAAIWDGSIPDCVHQNHLIRVRTDEAVLIPEYLLSFLNSDTGRHYFLGSGNTTSGLVTINTTIVKNCRIPLPSLPLQRTFAARVAEVRALEAKQAESRRRLDDLFQSLLHRAFRGEL